MAKLCNGRMSTKKKYAGGGFDTSSVLQGIKPSVKNLPESMVSGSESSFGALKTKPASGSVGADVPKNDGARTGSGIDKAGVIGMGAGLASTAINLIDSGNEKPSVVAGAASGALSGVASGAAFGVPGMIVSGLAGAFTGGISSWMEGDAIDKENALAEKARMDSIIATDKSAGNLAAIQAGNVGKGNNNFNNGGKIAKITNFKPTQPLAGGELKQISSDTQLASGNTHEQKNALGDGGITLADNKSVIENKELKVDKGDADLIISNNTALPNPYDKNKTFAQSYTVFAKKSGKLEDSKKMIDKNNLTLINRKRLMLEQMQQIMNGNSQGELV